MFNKIQPQQIDLHTFSSPSGTLNIEQGEDFVYFNLDKNLTGEFLIEGVLSVNGENITGFGLNHTRSGYNSALFGGNKVGDSGVFNGAFNSFSGNLSGYYNTVIGARDVNFYTSKARDNTIIGGKGGTISLPITGSVLIKDANATTRGLSENNQLLIDFTNGTVVHGQLNLRNAIHIDGSGLFSGKANFLQEVIRSGQHLVDFFQLSGMSGDLHKTIIHATGSILNNRILVSGSKALLLSGINTYVQPIGQSKIFEYRNASDATNPSLVFGNASKLVFQESVSTRGVITDEFDVKQMSFVYRGALGGANYVSGVVVDISTPNNLVGLGGTGFHVIDSNSNVVNMSVNNNGYTAFRKGILMQINNDADGVSVAGSAATAVPSIERGGMFWRIDGTHAYLYLKTGTTPDGWVRFTGASY